MTMMAMTLGAGIEQPTPLARKPTLEVNGANAPYDAPKQRDE
jgi:hypothetical protein